MWKCKHCKQDFKNFSASQKANHSRWCDKNPKKDFYNKNTSIMRAGITEESVKKRNLGISQAHKNGSYKDVPMKALNTKKQKGNLNHTNATKELIREKALASPHRRLVRSIREYVKLDGTVVLLDSSWEEILAKRLDEIFVEWIRPETPIRYFGNDGKQHNYFPDFYLPKYDVYLDPKNPMAMIAQKDKIEVLENMMTNLIVLKSLDECKNYNPI